VGKTDMDKVRQAGYLGHHLVYVFA